MLLLQILPIDPVFVRSGKLIVTGINGWSQNILIVIMQDKERETLKANAEELANLLTENIPFLIKYYVDNGVINEAEREDIVSCLKASLPAIYK